MSRTIRKPLRFIEENEESYIKHQLSSRFRRWNKGDNYNTRVVRRKKSQEQYEAEWEDAWKLYHEQLKKASYDSEGHPYLWMQTCGGFRENYIREPYVTKYHRIEVPWSIEQEIEELRKQYRKFTRDGHWNETGRNSGFKKASAKTVRLGNRRLEKKILADEDYDHLPYPNEHDGDFLRWSFW